MTKKFALVTLDGTACFETCLCAAHATSENKQTVELAAGKDRGYDAPLASKGWHDCSENEACECQLC